MSKSLLIAAMLFGAWFPCTAQEDDGIKGKPAPTIEAARWLNTDGIKLESLRGKVVVLYFWGMW